MDLDTISLGTGLPATPEAAAKLADKADELAKAFKANIANINAAVGQARERFETQHSAVIPRDIPKSQLAGFTGAVKAAVERDTREFRAALAKETDKDRTEQMRQAQQQAQQLAALATVYPSPPSYLSGTTVADPRRAQYTAALAAAGPAELATYARQALATNDRALAAAVVSRNDSLGKDARPLDSLAYATKFVGAEHKSLLQAAARADAAFQSMVLLNREAESGRTSPTARIGQGLRNHAASTQPDDESKIAAAMPVRR